MYVLNVFLLSDTKTNVAYPKDIEFWNDLFFNSTSWGLRWFLQDNLDEQMDLVDYINFNPTAARDWMLSLDLGKILNFISENKFGNRDWHSG